MKNTLNVLSIRVFGIIAFIAVFTLSAATCFSQSGGGGKSLNSPEALKEYLDSQPANSPDKPIKVSMGTNEIMLLKIRDVLNSAGKYVSLNLTGNALTKIPDYAFFNREKEKGCETLVGITIPDSVTIIGNIAFARCKNLTSIIIGKGVTSIEGKAFSDCTSLTSIGQAFNYCTSLTSITIPNSVTSIGYHAFDGCTSLTSVTFQGTITSVKFDENAFNGDLRDKYLAGGIGTYTTTTPVPAKAWEPVWTKK